MANYDATGGYMDRGLVTASPIGTESNWFSDTFGGTGGPDSGIGGAGGFDWGGTAKGFGSLAGGIGGLAQAWQGMQGLKLAKKSMAQQQENWDKNYEAQRADIAHNRGQRAAARSRQGSGYVVR